MADKIGKPKPAVPPMPPMEEALRPKPQHPLYNTSSSVYGARAPNEVEKMDKWFGQKGEFTKCEPPRGEAKTGFNTSVDKPRVHKDVLPS